MPIYEYSCRKCGKVIERIQKFSDPPLRRHPGCGGTLTKLVSQSAFQLKGSGWYVTDYARAGTKETPGDKGSSDESGAEGTSAGEEKSKPGKKKKKKQDSPSEKSSTST
jgi:putative FmdB family regulatory protein